MRIDELEARIQRGKLDGRKLKRIVMSHAHVAELQRDLEAAMVGDIKPYSGSFDKASTVPNPADMPHGWVLSYNGVLICRGDAVEVYE